MSLNAVHLIGHVGAAPEIIHFQTGTVLAKFPLAVNKNTKNKEAKPDWFEIVAWGKTAEVVGNYAHKGKQIAVRGSLKFDTWTDRNSGKQRSKPIINCDRVELLGSRRDDSFG